VDRRLTGIVPRRIETVALDRFHEEPVLLLQGPRSVGKSTLLRRLAAESGARILDLDDVATREAVASDPATFVAGPEPVCIDEYQQVPLVLDAIKAELNRDGRPGRFVLTGSARHESLPAAAQALTGRLHRLPVYPLSQGEIVRADERFLGRLFAGDAGGMAGRTSSTSREEYVERSSREDFRSPCPAPRQPVGTDGSTTTCGSRWSATCGSWPGSSRRRFSRSSWSAWPVRPTGSQPLAGGAGLQVGERTADNYLRLLEPCPGAPLPAWDDAELADGVASEDPRRRLGCGGAAAAPHPDKLARRDPSALTELGHLLETFVVAELMKQASWQDGVAASAMEDPRRRRGGPRRRTRRRWSGCSRGKGFAACRPSRDLAARKLRDAVGAAFIAA